MKSDKERQIKISKNWEKLKKELPDIEEQIKEDNIKVIKVKAGTKEPSEKDYYNAPSKIEGLKRHKGNYGLIAGYNHNKNGKSLAVIDIDGYSLEKSSEKHDEVKMKTKQDIFNCLKNIPGSLAVKSARNGYHIYLFNETIVDNLHDISKSLTFPSDYEIKELRNKSLEHSIEIFTKERTKYIVLPSSRYYNKATGKNTYYKVISDIKNISDIGTVNNIHELVKETMLANGYGFNDKVTNKKRSSTKNKNKHNNKRLKELNDNEISKVIELIVPIFKSIEGSKHEGTLALGGFFSYHISKDSAGKIASGIIKKIGSIFDDAKSFKKTLLISYERPIEEKAGLPSLVNLIKDLDPDFNTTTFSEKLNLLCNKKFKKEKVATTTINKNKVPVYLYETNLQKWLKYESIFEGIDLTLNFNKLMGSFTYTKTGKELDSFKFKFKNEYFEIIKFSELEDFLKTEGIDLPKYFEKDLRRSINNLDKSVIDKSVIKPKLIEETVVNLSEEDITEGVIKFGSSENSYYEQSEEKGINYIIFGKDGIISEPIANVIIEDVEIILDSLNILEPVYNVTYYNKTFKKRKTVKYLTKKQLTEEFIKANVFYNSSKEYVETVLNNFIIDGTKEGRILAKTEAYLEGYFIVDNHVVSNTKLDEIKMPTNDELAESIKLLNKIMEDRTKEGKANDSTVYRFMLWSPFSYCLKQLGYSKANYSLILIGTSQTNKTGATKVGNLFYNREEEETSGSTVSVLGSKIGENSFSSIFDECSHLFKISEALNVMKRAVYEKTGRAVKDRNDNSKIDEFVAFNLPLFLLNPEGKIEFKDFITNRYKVINYSNESFITEAAKKEFNEKYLPEAKDTILKKLALIGKVFSEKLIGVIEDPTKRKKLFHIEELTIELLKEIQREAGSTFNKAMLKETEASSKYDYKVESEIPKVLNAEFKEKNRLTGNRRYDASNFTNSIINNDFDFITYNKKRTPKTQHKEFIINTSGLEKHVNQLVEETVDLETILEALNLTDILKAKPDYKEPYSDYIKKKHKIQLGDGSEHKEKTISGIYLTLEELANNLFGFDIDFSSSENETPTLIKAEKVE